jgi:hypothetical protein
MILLGFIMTGNPAPQKAMRRIVYETRGKIREIPE